MKKWVTEIKAIDPRDGELKTWFGPYVPGINRRDAEMYCNKYELGYCKVIGELIAEIPYNSNEVTDYENTKNN